MEFRQATGVEDAVAMPVVLQGLLTIVAAIRGCFGDFYASDLLLDRVVFPSRGGRAASNIIRANQVRPWLLLFPAICAFRLYLVNPVIGSVYRSVFDRAEGGFIGFGNCAALAGDPELRQALLDTLLWVLVVPAMTTVLGLLVAQLTDGLEWGAIAGSVVFMPMAISFVGASLI